MIQLDTYGERGFAASWGYVPDWQAHVDAMKKTAGFKFNKPLKCWLSEGPEVLLDLERYQVPHQLTPAALRRAQAFRCQLNHILELRERPLSEELYSYQPMDAEVLAEMGRGLLGHPRGMGKSRMALDAAARLGAKMILVLVMFEGTLVYNWPDEVEKWHPEWNCAIVPDDKKKRLKFWQEADANVWVANSSKVLCEDWPIDAVWDYVIIDEVGRAKNRKTLTHKRLRKIAHSAKGFAGLGSHMEIKPEDTNAVFDLVRPSVFGDFWRFREQHLAYDRWGTYLGFKEHGKELYEERLAPWMLYRPKDIIGLPPILPNTVYVELSEAERAAYRRIEITEGGNGLVETIRHRQCVDSLRLLDPDGPEGSKFAALKEIVEEHRGKLVVFTFFAEMASLLALWLDTPYYVMGEHHYGLKPIKKSERVATVKAFGDSLDSKVLVCTDAGAYGLNMAADLIVQYDQLWNPLKMEQRRDRIHGIGRGIEGSRSNEIHLICKGTIDEGMMKVTQARREMFEDTRDGAERAALRKLGTSKLRRLIEGRL